MTQPAFPEEGRQHSSQRQILTADVLFPNWYPAAFYNKIIVHVQVLQEEAQTIGHATEIENRLNNAPIMKTCALRLRGWLVPGMELTMPLQQTSHSDKLQLLVGSSTSTVPSPGYCRGGGGGHMHKHSQIMMDAGVAEAIQHWSGLGVAIKIFLNR